MVVSGKKTVTHSGNRPNGNNCEAIINHNEEMISGMSETSGCMSVLIGLEFLALTWGEHAITPYFYEAMCGAIPPLQSKVAPARKLLLVPLLAL